MKMRINNRLLRNSYLRLNNSNIVILLDLEYYLGREDSLLYTVPHTMADLLTDSVSTFLYEFAHTKMIFILYLSYLCSCVF